MSVQARELQYHLQGVLAAFPVNVRVGKGYAEACPEGINRPMKSSQHRPVIDAVGRHRLGCRDGRHVLSCSFSMVAFRASLMPVLVAIGGVRLEHTHRSAPPAIGCVVQPGWVLAPLWILFRDAVVARRCWLGLCAARRGLAPRGV